MTCCTDTHGKPIACTCQLRIRFPRFPANLRAWREREERSLGWLSRRTGISKTYLWELETRDKCPSVDVVARIAFVMGISMETLLGPPEMDELTSYRLSGGRT